MRDRLTRPLPDGELLVALVGGVGSLDFLEGRVEFVVGDGERFVVEVEAAVEGAVELSAGVLADAVIDHMRWLRKLLVGKNDIEGDWVNIVINSKEPSVIIAAEYCRIYFRHGKYYLCGDTWNLAGEWVGEFVTSSGATYAGRELEYFYKTGIVNRVGGFGVILFSPPDSTPTQFICRYVDESTAAPHITRGVKVTDRLEAVDLERKRQAALAFAQEFDRSGLLATDALLKRDAKTA